MRIRRRLSAYFVPLACLLLLTSTAWVYTQLGRALRAEAMSHLESVASVQSSRVQDFIAGRREIVAQLQSRRQLRLSLAEYRRSGEATHVERVRRILLDALHVSSELRAVRVLAPDGAALLTVGEVAGPFGENEIARARSAAARRDIIVEPGDTPGTTLHRVPGELRLDGRLIGVVVAEFGDDRLRRVIEDRSGLGTTGETFLARRDANGNALFIVPLRFDPDAALVRVVARDQLAVPITHALLGRHRILEHAIDYRGEPVLAVSRYIPEMDWGLVVKADRSEMFAPLASVRRDMGLSAAAAIVIAFVVASWLAGRLVHPLEALTRAARDISGGQLDRRVAAEEDDEIGDLARSFNRMADDLTHAQQHLERQVAERTVELEELNARLEREATTDVLTRLRNRRYLDEQLQLAWQAGLRRSSPVSALLIDVDFFKPYNDNLGHEAGDRALVQVAEVVSREARRPYDVAARYGGEEFVVLLPDAGTEGAAIVAQRIAEAVEAAELEHPSSPLGPHVTVSVGAATATPAAGARAEDLIARADAALYRAKDEGRNRVVVAPEHRRPAT